MGASCEEWWAAANPNGEVCLRFVRVRLRAATSASRASTRRKPKIQTRQPCIFSTAEASTTTRSSRIQCARCPY
eukprot:3280354-Pleurochrysis_carterae.AAC.1